MANMMLIGKWTFSPVFLEVGNYELQENSGPYIVCKQYLFGTIDDIHNFCS